MANMLRNTDQSTDVVRIDKRWYEYRFDNRSRFLVFENFAPAAGKLVASQTGLIVVIPDADWATQMFGVSEYSAVDPGSNFVTTFAGFHRLANTDEGRLTLQYGEGYQPATAAELPVMTYEPQRQMHETSL